MLTRATLLISLGLIAAGCTASQSSPALRSTAGTVRSNVPALHAVATTSAAPELFVSNGKRSGGAVTTYAQAGHHQQEIRRMHVDGIPYGLATDSAGLLYVARSAALDVLVFAQGQGKPIKTLVDSEGGIPYDVAVGLDGVVYVSELGAGEPSNVAVYEGGASQPSYRVADVDGYPTGLALDPSSNLYVVWIVGSPGVPSIYKYAPGQTVGKSVGIDTMNPSKMAFDRLGNMLVVDDSYGQLRFYPSGKIHATKVVDLPKPDAKFIALSSDQQSVFVSDCHMVGSSYILEYSYPALERMNSIHTVGFCPKGLAVLPASS